MPDVKDLAYQDYLSGMKYKDIAVKHDINESTVKSWAARYWKNGKKLQPEIKKVATKDKKVATEKRTKRVEESVCAIIKEDDELTDKQRLFCIYWIKNKNATIAAIKAGYSPESAHVEGSRLLRNAKVREYIELFISEVKNNIMLDTSEIVERYMKIAFADFSDFVEWGQEYEPVLGPFGPLTTKDAVTGETIPVMRPVNTIRFKESTLVDGGLVCEISQSKNGSRIKLEDRQKALDWLSKFFMMNPMDIHKIEYETKRQKIYEQKMSGRIELDSLIDNDEDLNALSNEKPSK